MRSLSARVDYVWGSPRRGFGPGARARFAVSGGADFEDGFAVRWCLQLHGVAVALDLAGATLDQRRGDFGFRLGAGARCLFLGFDARWRAVMRRSMERSVAWSRPPVPAAGMARA